MHLPTTSSGDTEAIRIFHLQKHEREARALGYQVVAGVDEAGRGPLAGPVVAAVCAVSEEIVISGVNDSKQLRPRQREELYEKIIAHPDISVGIGMASAEEIDQLNVLQATFKAMLSAVENCSRQPDFLLVDGSLFPPYHIPCQKIVKGDAVSFLIACASIIAKETRDRAMRKYHELWPQYGFEKHKGYGTKEHIQAINTYGPSPIHRKSFQPVKSFAIASSINFESS